MPGFKDWELVSRWVLDELAEDDLFREHFCRDCEDAPRSRDKECPAGYDVASPDCGRCSLWSGVRKLVQDAIRMGMR